MLLFFQIVNFRFNIRLRLINYKYSRRERKYNEWTMSKPNVRVIQKQEINYILYNLKFYFITPIENQYVNHIFY